MIPRSLKKLLKMKSYDENMDLDKHVEYVNDMLDYHHA